MKSFTIKKLNAILLSLKDLFDSKTRPYINYGIVTSKNENDQSFDLIKIDSFFNSDDINRYEHETKIKI